MGSRLSGTVEAAMGSKELSPGWVHGVALAICFFGWIGLTLIFDGIDDTEQAMRAFSQAILFTSLMAAIDIAIWVYRQSNES